MKQYIRIVIKGWSSDDQAIYFLETYVKLLNPKACVKLALLMSDIIVVKAWNEVKPQNNYAILETFKE